MKKMQDEIKKCSSAILPLHKITNEEICETMFSLQKKLNKRRTREDGFEILTQDEINEIRSTLVEVRKMIESSFFLGGSTEIEKHYQTEENEWFIRPLSAKQESGSISVIYFLNSKDYAKAFHEFYDVVEDDWFVIKKYDNQEKYVSCKEAVLYLLLIQSFVFKLEEEKNVDK